MYKFAVLNYLVVIMNLIPLLELDGYYILADLIEVPDLREIARVHAPRPLPQAEGARAFLQAGRGLLLYGVLGVAFTIFSLYTAYYYWKTVFGDLVSRLWAEGPVTRLLLLILAVFIAGPLLRGLIKLLRAVGREVRAVWRRIRFRLETGWRVEASELIDALPMFEDIPVDALNEIAGRVRLRDLGDGSRPSGRATNPTRSTWCARASSRWWRRMPRAARNAGSEIWAEASRSGSSGW